VYVVSEQAQVLRTHLSEIRNTDRVAQGVTIFKPAKGDAVASISCVSDLSLPDEADGKASKPKGKAAKASTNGRRNGRANGAQPKLELE
jgi:DNA gyrase/topoisomerase IV subunit A